jgi:osmotically-inducible protein OsmY
MVHGLALLTNDALSQAKTVGRTGAMRLLLTRAQDLLQGSSHRALGRVSCVEVAGVLQLRGSVPSFYMKQLAQSLLLSMKEAPRVRNELIVGQAPDPRKTK